MVLYVLALLVLQLHVDLVRSLFSTGLYVIFIAELARCTHGVAERQTVVAGGSVG